MSYLSRLGRFVRFFEEDSLFTFIIPSGHGRSLASILERFHRRREELARELGLSGLEPLSFITLRFVKRANRHIIGRFVAQGLYVAALFNPRSDQLSLFVCLHKYWTSAIKPKSRSWSANTEVNPVSIFERTIQLRRSWLMAA